MFTGSFVATITPFTETGLDLEALTRHVNFLVENGSKGIVPCGTTGEAPTLSSQEWEAVVDATVKATRHRAMVIAGTGSNNTAHSLELTTRAQELGADAALVVAPYYNKPTQAGLYNHFRAVAEATALPIVIYNIPGRTGVNLLPETLERLARDCPNVKAIKEASGNLDQVSEIIRRCGDRLSVLSGDDSLTLPIMALGGTGVISVTANIVPKEVAELCNLMLAGQLTQARRMHYLLLPLNRALFFQTNPIPVKTALEILGRASGRLRLPLCPPSAQDRTLIESALRDFGLLGKT
ncbi:MAG: 4-hydroxy-tetrahydrodipicolinate synthase [candidate division WOR-3 bacterium]